MPTTPATEPAPDVHPPEGPAPRSGRARLAWAGLLLPLLAIGGFVAAETLRPAPEPATIGSAAPDFELADTAGGIQSLERALADGAEGALLYFSMGVGCGGCFAQIPEIEPAMTERGIRLVSVVVDDPGITRIEAERYGATDPIALDPDRSVSEAYGMLGVYGHGDRPSHSFVRVDAEGTISDVVHYAEMFVPRDQLLADLDLSDRG
ncbi:MAG: redoxin domain-containing protein [Actinobacteria bacterium]|nr:redoxin domain-containing protein [Actinomycetota bacterium]